MDRTIDALAEVLIVPGVALLIGLGLFVLAWRAWTGRWRSWARWPLWSTIPIHLYPSVGLFLVAYSLDAMVLGPTATDIVYGIVIGPIAGLTVIYLLAAIFGVEPRWATPRWFHDTDRSPDLHDEMTAILAAGAELGRPRQTLEHVRQVFADHPQLHRWGVSLVVDPSATERAHGLAVAGTVNGRLRVYPTGVGFHSAATEERLRSEDDPLEAVVVHADELRGVRTVPRGADADGQHVPHPTITSRFHRSPYRRLVLDTTQGPYLFELWAAARRADLLAELYDVERGPDA